MSKNKIGYLGCKPELPQEFPISFPENSGNMIHARAPKEMFPQAVYAKSRFPKGESFRTWVDKEASHVVVTLANTIKLNQESAPNLVNLIKALDQYDAEIVVFGMGIQAKTNSLEGIRAAPEAIQLMQYLGDRCKIVGVRGEFTKQVFEKLAGVKNTYVTGCPSLFSRPSAVRKLYENVRNGKVGRPAFNGTYFHLENEKKLLIQAIKNKNFLVEPVNKHNHAFHVDLMNDESEGSATIPYFLKGAVANGDLNDAELRDYFVTYYRLFRQAPAWYSFNEEFVSFSYGSRFHGNMAAYLSGVPSLWLTHDARTEELVNFLHLPSLDLGKAAEMDISEIMDAYDPTDFFDNIREKFDNFNGYLENVGLPQLELDF